MAVYEFSCRFLFDKYGQGGVVITYTGQSGVPYLGTSPNPIPLVQGDIIRITHDGGIVGVEARTNAGLFGAFDLDYYLWDATDQSTQDFVLQNVASGGDLGTINLSDSNAIVFTVAGDSTFLLPTLPDLLEQPLDSQVTTSFTVSGLGTGLAAGLTGAGGLELRKNSGSWESVDYPNALKVVNGDIIDVRATTPNYYGAGVYVELVSIDLSGVRDSASFIITTEEPAGANYGIQAWDANGDIQLNMSSRLGRFYASGVVSALVTDDGSGSGEFLVTVSIPGMDTSDAWYIPCTVSESTGIYSWPKVIQGTDEIQVGATVRFSNGYTSQYVYVTYRVLLGG